MRCLGCKNEGGLFFVGPDGARHLGPHRAHGLGLDADADEAVLRIAARCIERKRALIAASPTGDPTTDELLALACEALGIEMEKR